MAARRAAGKPAKGPPGAPKVGKRSKTGDPQCSEAMSTWVRLRNAGASIAPAVFAMLGKCRSLARQRNKASALSNAGQDLKAQALRHRLSKGVDGAITQAERRSKAEALLAERRTRNAARAARRPQERPAAEAGPKPAPGGFSLMAGRTRGPARFENAGGKRTPFMFDMKKGDLPGQTSLMDRVGTVHTHEGVAPKKSGETPDAWKAAAAAQKEARREKRAAQRQLAKVRGEYAAKFGEKAADDALARSKAKAEAAAGPREYVRPSQVDTPAQGAAAAAKASKEAAWRNLQQAKRLKKVGKASAVDVMKAEFAHSDAVKRHKESRGAIEARAAELGKTTEKPVLKRQRSNLAGAPSAGPKPLRPVAEPARAKPAAAVDPARRGRLARQVRTYRAAELEHKAPERFGRVGKTYEFNADQVHFDPDRFQYKLAAQGSHGTTDALKDVRKWDPELAGALSVWRDPADGRTYVVNGHHRLDLAKRLGVGKVTARLIDAADHREARAKGALVNIAEGRGTALDAAKFFRESKITPEALAAKGVSLREHTASQGLAMSGLSDRAFRRAVDGSLSTNRAAIVGGSGLSHEQQDQLLKVLDKPKNARLTDGTVRAMAEDARAAGSRTKEVRDLFGSSAEEESLFIHRAKLTDAVARDLSKDRRLFGLVSKSKAAAALAERGRSTIDVGETGKVADEASAVLQTFHQLRNRHPAISRTLNQAAERIADGARPEEVQRETRKKLSEQIRRILSGDDDPFA